MIKASELRVGNIIKFPYRNEPLPVASIERIEQDGGGYEYYATTLDDTFPRHISLLDPIPLTPELLERCGFDDLRKEMINVEFADKHHAINECNNGWTFYPFCTNDKDLEINITSLHQLMNLYFALTGSELAIKND